MARCSPSLRSDCDVDRSILLVGGLVALHSAQHRKLPHGEPRLVEEAGVLEGLDVGEVAERVEAEPGEESLRRHMAIGRARHDSNVRPLPSEGRAPSSRATGA